jgi:hypothetical protein
MEPYMEDKGMRQDIAVALKTTRAHGFGYNHSLCHGDLGNLDLLLEARLRLGRADLQSDIQDIAARIVADMRQNGWRCGNPLGVESPGLMTGLAGIGYELLRLAEPTRVPSSALIGLPQRPSGNIMGLQNQVASFNSRAGFECLDACPPSQACVPDGCAQFFPRAS